MHEATTGNLILARELDVASGVVYVCGKDGHLYRPHDVGAAKARADRGDAVAREALRRVDFGVDDTGAELDDDAINRAIETYRAAWERGEFDHLCELGELLPRKPSTVWLHATRARRERREAAIRQRRLNSSIVPRFRTPEAWAQDRPPGGFALAGDELRAALRAAGYDDRAAR